jgi:hypothetical protein
VQLNPLHREEKRKIGLEHARGKRAWPAILMLLCMVLAVVVAIGSTRPPAAVSQAAPADQFASGRAMEDLNSIATEVHSSGTPGHDRVRDQIVAKLRALGVDPQVQDTTAFRQSPSIPFDRAAHTQNILARLKGSTGVSKQAVLLMTHYSSSLHSNGAGDGMNVSALLEVMRAIQAGPPLQRDVIFLFTDAKEPLPTGSQAFVGEHPWASDVSLALNFDALGSGGPVVMFETTERNGALVGELARTVSSPFANSLLYDLYKLTKYDTDFSVLKDVPDQEMQGLNFAFALHGQHFHNESDTVANVDERTLQQTGEYALQLARHFANGGEDAWAHGENAVFFNIGSLALVHYPASWSLPLAILAAILFALLLILARRKQQLTVKGLLGGFLLFLLSLVAAAGIAFGLGVLIGLVTDPFALISHDLLFAIAFACLTLAVITAVHALFGRKIGLFPRTMGAALGWLLLTFATAVFLPAGSFLFAWPLLFLLGAAFRLHGKEEPHGAADVTILVLAALPALLLGAQFAYLLFMLLTLSVPAVLVAVMTLIGSLLVPQWHVLLAFGKRWVPLTFAGLALVLLLTGVLLPPYSAESPKPDNLFYGYDADAGTAAYGSVDPKADAFTKPYLTGATAGDFHPYFPSSLNGRHDILRAAPASVVPVPSPELQVLADKTDGNLRTLHLRLTSPQPTWNQLISMSSDGSLLSLTINGKQMRNRNEDLKRWEVLFYAPPKEGIDLVLNLQPTQHVTVRLVDGRDGMPDELHLKRPANIITNYFSDMTYVSKTYSL